jgi:hypothetical protein
MSLLLRLVQQARAVRAQLPGAPVAIVWRDAEDSDAAIEAAIAEKAAAGVIGVRTQVLVVGWMPATAKGYIS